MLTPRLSAALDLLRFGLALTVAIGHAAYPPFSNWFLWPAITYGQTSVMGFFVLSGFVVAEAARRTPTAGLYAAARLSRLWSICVPAVLLTLVVDAVGRAADPFLYVELEQFLGRVLPIGVGEALGTPLALSFLHELWAVRLVLEHWPVTDSVPGTNGPYWSLGYEAVYYLGFGFVLFLRGARRWAALASLLLLAGPTVGLLALLWGAGAGLARAVRRYGPPPVGLALPVGLAGAALVAFSPLHREATGAVFAPIAGVALSMEVHLPGDLLDGVGWSGIILALAALLRAGEVPPARAALARTFGRLTFPLYLIHFPVLALATSLSPFAPGDWPWTPLWLAVWVVAAVLALGPAMEATLPWWRAQLIRLFGPRGVTGEGRAPKTAP